MMLMNVMMNHDVADDDDNDDDDDGTDGTSRQPLSVGVYQDHHKGGFQNSHTHFDLYYQSTSAIDSIGCNCLTFLHPVGFFFFSKCLLNCPAW